MGSGRLSITLEIRPQQPPYSWDAFLAAAPRFAVALDGYVGDGPRFDPAGPRVNFNHHENVSRLETRATCGQVLLALRQGLYQCFRDPEGPRATVFANDCDEDVCTSWFLLKHGHLAVHALNPLLDRLVSMEDLLDATAGGYPFPAGLPALRERAWVFDPYRRFRLSGEIDRKEAGAFQAVATEVEARILQHITGKGGELPLDVRYERLGGGDGWAMIRELGAQARTGVFADGIYAYVAVRMRPDARYTYTVGRMSPFIHRFRVPAMLEALNAAEGTTGAQDRWGGGDTIGGSPRVAGSRLAPDAVASIVSEVIAAGA